MHQPSKSKPSVSQILLACYVAITAPAIWLAIETVDILQDGLVVRAEQLQDKKLGLEINKNRQMSPLGAFLRKNNFPFTKSNAELTFGRSTALDVGKQNLLDARAAVIYGWAGLFAIGFLSYSLLALHIHRTFRSLTGAVERLYKHQMNEEIDITGPADARNISVGLENLRVKLNDEERLQQQFLRHISHEIKTPLTSIKEGSKLLDEQMLGTMNEEQQEITKILVKSSTELQDAIENLLNYNVAVAESDGHRREPTDLKQLVNDALEKHELTIKNKGLIIKNELEAPQAMVDPTQVLTVFDNLISNAIKHSPNQGTINIWLQNKKGDKAGFIIKDQGPGIPADQEPFIFDPFFVGEQASQTTLKGTGLGLSIAKQFVNDHSGELKLLKSRKGAAFQVTLPSIRDEQS